MIFTLRHEDDRRHGIEFDLFSELGCDADANFVGVWKTVAGRETRTSIDDHRAKTNRFRESHEWDRDRARAKNEQRRRRTQNLEVNLVVEHSRTPVGRLDQRMRP